MMLIILIVRKHIHPLGLCSTLQGNSSNWVFFCFVKMTSAFVENLQITRRLVGCSAKQLNCMKREKTPNDNAD